MRKLVIGAAICACAMAAAALAVANPASDTVITMNATGSPSTSGTRSNPRPVKLYFDLTSATRSGTGQGETSEVLVLGLPRQWRINLGIFPNGSRYRCSAARANAAKSDSVCPRRSKVGGTTVVALAGNGAVTRNLLSGIYVLTNGRLGLWVQSKPGEAPSVGQMLNASIRGKNIRIPIPKEVKEPIPGLRTAIKQLVTRNANGRRAPLGASFRYRGETRGLFESTGCPRGGWTVAFTKETLTGNVRDTDRAPCRNPRR